MGVVRTADGLPIAGALVEARTWLSGTPIPLRRSVLSDAEGSWRLDNLPTGQLTLFFEAEGVAPLSFPIEVAGSPHHVGETVLTPAHLLRIEIVDTTGLPLAGEVRIRGRSTITADADGEVVVDLFPAEPFEAVVDAPGHTGQTVRRFPPLPPALQVRLEPAVVVRGRFLDPQGVPAIAGQVEVKTSSTLATRDVGDDGSFEIELRGGEEAILRFTSPTTAAFERTVPARAAGERVDLGDLTAPTGLTVTGTTGLPVAGARVWTPRPGPRGLQMAWVLGDLLQATSDAAGAFVLAGLPRQPLTLRIEAGGLAPRRVALTPEEDETFLDLGELVIGAGAELAVTVEAGTATPRSAHLDLGGRGLELDRVTAPFRDGEALLRHLPAGSFDLAVLADGSVICRTAVVVEEGAGRQAVHCEREPLHVEGVVEVGGRRVGRRRGPAAGRDPRHRRRLPPPAARVHRQSRRGGRRGRRRRRVRDRRAPARGVARAVAAGRRLADRAPSGGGRPRAGADDHRPLSRPRAHRHGRRRRRPAGGRGAGALARRFAHGMRVVSSDQEGHARAELPEGGAGALRVAAFHQGRWALGAPRPALGRGDGTIPLAFGPTGSLLLTGEDEVELSPRLVSADGWDLAVLHSWIGEWLRIAPGAVLELAGLPIGSYVVEAGPQRVAVAVSADERTEVDLDP